MLRVCLLGKGEEMPFRSEASARVEVQGRRQHGVLGTAAAPFLLWLVDQHGVEREQRDRPKHESLECRDKGPRSQPGGGPGEVSPSAWGSLGFFHLVAA